MSTPADRSDHATDDEFQRAGREALADELYDLRCALRETRQGGEELHAKARAEWIRQGVAAREPLVGDLLHRQLAAADDRLDGVTASSAPHPADEDPE